MFATLAVCWFLGPTATGTLPGPTGIEPSGSAQSGEQTAAKELEEAASAFEAASRIYKSVDRHVLHRWAVEFQARSGNEDAHAQQAKIEDSEGEFLRQLNLARDALERAQVALDIDEAARSKLRPVRARSSSEEVPELWNAAARQAREAAAMYRGDPELVEELRRKLESEEAEKDSDKKSSPEERLEQARQKAAGKGLADTFAAAEKATHNDAWLVHDIDVATALMITLALLFAAHATRLLGPLFKVVPLLVFAYFVPTVLSNTGIIPIDAPVYGFIKSILLPASLVLLVLSVDIPAVLRLGKPALILFGIASLTIVIGGPLAYLALGWMVPDALHDQAWRGLAAVAGSWIGGGANFVAIGESAGASASTMGMMVIVDVAVAEVWMIVLLFFAGREKKMDAKIGADRRSLDAVRDRIEAFEKKVSKPTTLPALLTILALAFGVTALAVSLAPHLPELSTPWTGVIVKGFTWTVLIVTTIAVVLSFTPLRKLEGAGASKVGSTFLYLLIGSIGASAEFRKVLDIPSLVAIGALWMTFHAVVMLTARKWLKAPIFFAAVGSKANVGGAASAPILASAFHPALAPVGVLLAVLGYVLGTYLGLICRTLLEMSASVYAG